MTATATTPPPLHMPARSLPHGATAAAVLGWLGGAFAWMISSRWTELTPSLSTYGRLDQWSMLLLGSMVGALVLAGRARHRRESVVVAFLAGVLLGGAPAVAGATVALLVPASETPRAFLTVRLFGWGVSAALVSAALASYTRAFSFTRVLESALLALLGGVASGAMLSLPGPAELWLPCAMTWFGAIVGFAAVGPGLWRAPVVVRVLPARQARRGLLSLNERAIDDGWSMLLSECTVGCVDQRVFVYPPPGGASLDGHSFYRPMHLTHDALLTVGRARYRLMLARWRT